MTAPIRPRIPLAASDARVIVRRSAARHDRAVAAAAVLPPKPRHAGCGPIPLPRLSAHDHDDVTLVRVRGELDPSGTAVLHTQLRDIRWRARAPSIADLTGLPVPGRATRSPVFPAIPVQPTIPLVAQQCIPAPSSPLSELDSVSAARHERRRHVQPRHAHDRIPGAHQRVVILPPCPASGQRRGTF